MEVFECVIFLGFECVVTFVLYIYSTDAESKDLFETLIDYCLSFLYCVLAILLQ